MGASHMLSFVSFSLSLLSQIPAALAHSALQPGSNRGRLLPACSEATSGAQ